ncbi:MAG: hypothetical protein B7Z60_05335 [Ferrovum sp. 37-45-19]|jgi:4a-hydroxytetrahydrobiopterin dehydratase|uniref:4a-hydroxytetrahydrobiopterin dehydratase n=1 Tax=Ferrovum sp. JA12 TaxID=1356299 RepID=UPI0007037D48|nr:4a-hydroxytetrahydrobiopterin dehydratase [Ferrovum sp. JA12]OYV79000.1 MAG: hypothetical protein B7Z65_08075 [Ferrovum sp. 21-44-67]OYV94367.1 MAG: hypothetical protein B7Z60_05335 [Ferrovum sp. 37-45-19]OZB33254.1 MAG: hypothetical protein B7X47_04885 [Ferrovum sp. 34-44-207]HQT80626.1 4a-hydroxytetrahydrobiopterin dehydratase [Ferrovaceae bacterium]KRH79715.1 putative pterin-4-alpha-carbinolamine dehydratase [Ferrovum sp. JA12]
MTSPITLLSDLDIARALAQHLTHWSYHPPALWRKWSTHNWQQSMDLALKISAIAERLDHHPNLTIKYGEVILELYSHDVTGITQRDLEFARMVEQSI